MPDRSADAAPDRRRLVVTISPGTATAAVLMVIGSFALWSTLQSARSILGMAVASAVVAVLVSGPIDLLNRHLPKAVAVLVVVLVGLGSIGGVGYSIYGDLDAAFTLLQKQAPAAARQLESSERFGEVATDLRLEDRVQSAVDGLRSGAEDRARSTAFRAVNYFVAFVLAIFFLVYGSRIFKGGLSQIRDPRRRVAVERVVREAIVTARAYLGIELANALVLGLATGVIFHQLGLPGASALALLVALGSVVPDVGVVVGGVPALLLIAAFEPGTTLAVAFAGLVAVQLVEAFYAHRILVRKLRVGSAVTLMALLIGFGIYGISGAVFGVAIAVFLSALVEAAGSAVESEDDRAAHSTSDV